MYKLAEKIKEIEQLIRFSQLIVSIAKSVTLVDKGVK